MMIVCPMCEHQQAPGIECEVCGKKLATAAPVAVAVATLPELEQTQLAGGRAPVAVASIPDLELTHRDSVPNVTVQAVPELDTGRSAKVGNVAAAPMQDMDTGRAAAIGAKTVAPTGPVICRYCRTPQEGAVCENCGVRVPKARLASAGPTREARVAAGERTKCPKCSSPAHAGRACVTCGTLVPAAE
jgi:hypothetical protein